MHPVQSKHGVEVALCPLLASTATILSTVFLEWSCQDGGTLGLIIRCEDVFRSEVGGTMWGWHAAKCARGGKVAALVEKDWDCRELLIKSFLYGRALPEFFILLSQKGICLYLQHEWINSATVSSRWAMSAAQFHGSQGPDCAAIWAMAWEPSQLSSLDEHFSAAQTAPQVGIGAGTTSDSLFSTAKLTEWNAPVLERLRYALGFQEAMHVWYTPEEVYIT